MHIIVISDNELQKINCTGPIQYSDKEDPARSDSHLVAALGINWAHAVTIRLVLESISGLFDH